MRKTSGSPLQETTGCMVYLGVIPCLIPCFSHRSQAVSALRTHGIRCRQCACAVSTLPWRATCFYLLLFSRSVASRRCPAATLLARLWPGNELLWTTARRRPQARARAKKRSAERRVSMSGQVCEAGEGTDLRVLRKLA